MSTRTKYPFDISWKAILAFLFPFISALVATGVSWLQSGEFNKAEIITSVAGLAASALAALGAYVGKPGAVVPKPAAHHHDD